MVSEEYLRELKSQKFGIEVEFSFITRDMAKAVLGEVFSSSSLIDDLGRQWRIVRDCSIKPRKHNSDGRVVVANDAYKVELISPLLGYSDLDLLSEVISVLRKAGAEPSDLCGIHVHVSEDGHTVSSLRNLINLFIQKEYLMVEAFQISPERRSRYCKDVCLKLIEVMNKHKPRTFTELRELWICSNCDRSRMLNLESFYSKKGIEFRLFNSTLNVPAVKAYIVFCLAISQKAKTMQRAVPVRSAMSNNRYEWRNFLNRLGLAGDEFKTVRKELLKHVSGDSAFHTPEEHNRRRLAR